MKAKKPKKPKFLRQEWFRHKNTRKKWLKWRRPRGKHSKLRKHVLGKGFRPQPGYGSPKAVKGLHPSGLREVLVHNLFELNALDPKTRAARIAKGVGVKKRVEMQAAAEKMKLKILNRKKVEMKKKAEKPLEKASTKQKEKPEKKEGEKK